ncbi:hypothetical protein GOBAR_AA18968 [Gossypium barbadense]|uniref:Uncharacterized protein n=1 Tax=Gossypium barbadense TaxID=3634 RepID=A0A2P5XED1_GOSBA|nr:hypothetical protein GOBAR_AA18968 [Gossypium barbadense]
MLNKSMSVASRIRSRRRKCCVVILANRGRRHWWWRRTFNILVFFGVVVQLPKPSCFHLYEDDDDGDFVDKGFVEKKDRDKGKGSKDLGMGVDMARLQISDGKEEEVLQIGGITEGMHRLYDLCFVGCFLNASVVQF